MNQAKYFYFLFVLACDVSAKCNIGQWPSNHDNLREMCHECPSGFECNGVDIPRQCSVETRALGSAGKCCPRNMKCLPGFAVDNNDCACVSLSCPQGLSLVQSQFRLHCEQANAKCKPCIVKSMVQNENCQCFHVKVCGQGNSFWKYGANYFEC